ncbi:unnamed protein product, partial [Meganyctiphanes norvegica]
RSTWWWPSDSRWYIPIDTKKHHKVCKVPKAGSTSWRMMSNNLRKQRIFPPDYVNIIAVRHPFERLLSAYKDKFLGGESISKYDEAWRSSSGSGESWNIRWRKYWLPALVSNGRIEMSPVLKTTITTLKMNRAIYLNNNNTNVDEVMPRKYESLQDILYQDTTKWNNLMKDNFMLDLVLDHRAHMEIIK